LEKALGIRRRGRLALISKDGKKKFVERVRRGLERRGQKRVINRGECRRISRRQIREGRTGLISPIHKKKGRGGVKWGKKEGDGGVEVKIRKISLKS